MANILIKNVLEEDCREPKYNGKNLTNRVLIQTQLLSHSEDHKNAKGKEPPQSTRSRSKSFIRDPSKVNVTYYCPAYMRLKIKNFSEMSLSDLSATINQVLTLTLNFKGIYPSIQDQIQSMLVLRFNRDEPLSLEQNSNQVSVKKQKQDLYTYTIRKHLNTGMKTQIFLTPFEVVYLIQTIRLDQIQLEQQELDTIIKSIQQSIEDLSQEIKTFNKPQDEKDRQKLLKEKRQLQQQVQSLKKINNLKIGFNFMDLEGQPEVKISFTEEGTFGEYDLAQRMLKAQYTNEELAQRIRNEVKLTKDWKEDDYQTIREFQYCHFEVPLYKFPLVTLLTIFVPLWLLGILNLGVFFQDVALADRIGSLSTLLIAFVALLPTIRQMLPPNPNITLVEIFVYLQSFTVLLCLIDSIIVRHQDNYDFIWYESGRFLTCFIIEILEIGLVLCILIIHYTYMLKKYNKNTKDTGEIKFDYLLWENQKCDRHFRRKLDAGIIKVLTLPQKK